MHHREEQALNDEIKNLQNKLNRLNLGLMAVIKIMETKTPFTRNKFLATMKKIDRAYAKERSLWYSLYDFIDFIVELRQNNSMIISTLCILEDKGLVNVDKIIASYDETSAHYAQKDSEMRKKLKALSKIFKEYR